jgi:hypothetical protein
MLSIRALPSPLLPRFKPGGILAAVLVAASIAPASAAAADDAAPSIFKFSGFGTLGVVHADTDTADFTSSVLKASGAGATRRWSMDVDTRLGAQVDVAIAPKWSAVLQVVSEQGYNNSYRPDVEWANVKYQVTPDVSVRVGRVALPVFMAAEHRKVGYVYSMVRQPNEVEGGVPITSSDGIELSGRWHTGALRHTTRLQYGRTNLSLDNETRVHANGIVALSHSIDVGALSVRGSAIGADVTVNLADPLFGALKQFGPAGVALADQYSVDHKRITLIALGMEYDPGDWFVTIEGGRQRSQSLLGTNVGLALFAGYRWRAFTPYIGYSDVRAQASTQSRGLPTTGLPPQLAYGAGVLNAGLNQLLMTLPEQSAVRAGTRWDFHENMALKLQVDNVTPHRSSRGTLINTQPGFVFGKSIWVTSMTLDFVF